MSEYGRRAWTGLRRRNSTEGAGRSTREVQVWSRPRERIIGRSEKRRDGAWTEVARNDEVACGLLKEGALNGAGPSESGAQ
jgi:hypothetical protein